MDSVATVLIVAVVITVLAVVFGYVVRNHRHFGTPAEVATFETLHQASLAAPPLRAGLTSDGVHKSIKHLHALLGTAAVALTDSEQVLAWDGSGDQHARDVMRHVSEVLAGGRGSVLGPDQVACEDPECAVRHAVLAPLIVDHRVVGVLAAYDTWASAGLVRATREVARWVSSQVELAELDRSRTRLMEADLRALRAQISPHFVYNSLNAIASFVRTDPDRARELLLEFAEFTRYSLRSHGDFTTLAEELRCVDRYLLLERARFGERLEITLQVAPEVLPVAVPFLCLQPIVENAVHHGLEGSGERGHITILAQDAGAECSISVEDNGLGMDPELMRRALASEPGGDSMGLGNVDERLRTVFGDGYGLVVETAPGAGTKVSMRIPKYKVGVHAL